MLAVDTNVLVRFFTRDDPKQAARAASLMRSNEVWVSKTVLLETEWVLRSSYGLAQEDVTTALRGLAGLENVRLEDPLVVVQALHWSAEGLDFADALHLASSGEATKFATFDEKFAKKVRKLTALEVRTA